MIRQIVRIGGVSLLCSFLVFTPYIRLFINPDNRAFRNDWTDPLSLWLAVLLAGSLLGLFLFIVWRSLGKDDGWVPGRSGLVVLFWVSVFLATRNLSSESTPYWHRWDWAFVPAVLCLIVSLATRYASTVRRGTFIAMRVLAPLMLVMSAYFINEWRSMDRPGAAPVVPADPTASPDLPDIYVWIFDTWGYRQAFREGTGELDGRMTHLRRVASESTVYHGVSSPSYETKKSIPRIIHQSLDGSSAPTLYDRA
ncbi:MAG TPA: hypothetical protein PK876_06465, partial [Elusimicrobiota bacterium]|nr:hypothetical protein [Elusimicrobiota bacterium]